MQQQNNLKQINYSSIDFMKFVMAFFVVALHIHPLILLEQKYYFRFFASLFRLAVPFFFLSTGFLLGQKLEKYPQNDWNTIFLKYAKKLLKYYCIWSIIYLPISLYGSIYVYQYSLTKGIIRFTLNLLFVGENYNSWILWYILSAIYTSFFFYIMLKNNISIKITIVFACFIYLLGFIFDVLIEYSLGGKIIDLLKIVFNNGRITVGFGFISLGIIISKYKNCSIKLSLVLFFLFYILLVLCNEYFFSPILLLISASLLFIIVINYKNPDNKNDKYIYFRTCSSVLYFTHLWIWSLINIFFFHEERKGFIAFLITVILCMFIASFWFIYLKLYRSKKYDS